MFSLLKEGEDSDDSDDLQDEFDSEKDSDSDGDGDDSGDKEVCVSNMNQLEIKQLVRNHIFTPIFVIQMRI